MATIKVFDVNGCKELSCFDTLDNVAYLPVEEQCEPESEPEEQSED